MSEIKVYNKPSLKNSISSHRSDIELPNVPNINKRHEQIKFVEDDIKGPIVTLQDNSDALLLFMSDNISPYVTIDSNESIKVPVVWMNREKWSQVANDGYFKDSNGKLQCPVIAIRKTSVQPRDEMRKPNVLNTYETMWTVQQKYDSKDIYDQYSVLTGVKRQPTTYKVAYPDYVFINYNIHIWTDTEAQLDQIIEKLLSYNNLAFGDKNYYKFTVKFDNFIYDTNNAPSAERKITCVSNLTLNGYILQEEYWYNNNVTKFLEPERIVSKEL